MRICAISDMHGNYDFNIEPCDILCICGDIVPLNIQSYTKPTFKWLEETFIPWCQAQPCKEVLLVAGNHDRKLEHHESKLRGLFIGTKIHYLLDETYEYIDEESGNTYKFHGTPWCHIFGNWAFMISDEQIAENLKKMPDDVDVLLTHDAPYGTSDICLQNVWWNKQEHIGCKPLADTIREKKPKINLHGHLHSTNHAVERLLDTDVYCVSLLDERYEMTYKPLYLEI